MFSTNMYMIFKGTRPAGNRRFDTYEEARAHARSIIRRHLGGIPRHITTNPSLGDFGYSVRVV